MKALQHETVIIIITRSVARVIVTVRKYQYLPVTVAGKNLTVRIAYRLPPANCLPLTIGNLLTAYRLPSAICLLLTASKLLILGYPRIS